MSLGVTGTTTSFGSYATSEGACRTSVSLEKWSDTHTGPLTTLCDDIPRAVGPREIVTKYYPGTGPCVTGYTTYSNVEELYREPSQTPHCTLQTSECIPIWSTWSTLSSSWRSSIVTSSYGDTNSPIRPLDCPKTGNYYPEENPCSACHFLPGTATLFYWPTTTIDGDLCLQNGTTISASGPTTAIVNGKTFTSPTAYVSFTTIYAWSNRRAHQGFQCGIDHSDAIISVNPETLSSMRNHRNAKYPTIGTAYPFNFAEFMPQQLGNETQSIIPWPQYRGGQQCPLGDANSCTMVRDDYAPWLMLPEEVREIDAGWTVCDRRWYIPTVTMVALDREEIIVTSTPNPTEQVEVFAAAAAAAAPEDALAAPTPQATTAGW